MLTLVLAVTLMTTPDPDLKTIGKMSPAERQKLISQLPKENLAKLYESISTEDLLAIGRASAERLGEYSATVVKRERVDGKLLDAQTVEIVVRGTPLAVKANFISGPAKGRTVVYDSTVKKDQMRAKEGGLLGIAGAIWIGVNSSLARGDSNHPITDFGFEPVIRLLEDAFAQARPMGGFTRTNEGFDAQGRYCQTYNGPKGGEKLYATKAKLCFDPVLALPVWLEIDDAKGRLESYYWSNVKQVSKPAFEI